jgi:hypothetical protein
MNRDLPIYEMVVDDSIDNGVDFVALVDRPAIQKDFIAFSDQKPYRFDVVSEERRLIAGPLMLADLPIYRIINGEECYVVFLKTLLKRSPSNLPRTIIREM